MNKVASMAAVLVVVRKALWLFMCKLFPFLCCMGQGIWKVKAPGYRHPSLTVVCTHT